MFAQCGWDGRLLQGAHPTEVKGEQNLGLEGGLVGDDAEAAHWNPPCIAEGSELSGVWLAGADHHPRGGLAEQPLMRSDALLGYQPDAQIRLLGGQARVHDARKKSAA